MRVLRYWCAALRDDQRVEPVMQNARRTVASRLVGGTSPTRSITTRTTPSQLDTDLQAKVEQATDDTSAAPTTDTAANRPSDSTTPPHDTKSGSVADKDRQLMEAYREKFGGESTATFEDGAPTEMARSVRSNLFRCTSDLLIASIDSN